MELKQFWPQYVLAHRKPGTQWFHAFGTLLGVGLLVAGVVSADYRLILTGFVAGYALAWIGHFFVEHNMPETFHHPFLSFVCDFRLTAYVLTGRMAAEIRRCEAARVQAPAPPGG